MFLSCKLSEIDVPGFQQSTDLFRDWSYSPFGMHSNDEVVKLK